MENIFMYIAFPATIIYLILIAFSLIELGSADSHMAEFEEDLEINEVESTSSMQVFTFRNLLVFLVGLGWAGLFALVEGQTGRLAAIIGISVGLAAIAIQISLFYFMSKLSQPNEPSIKSAIGQMGTVYLTIPAQKRGTGKVTVIVNGTVRTLTAMTNGEELKTGSLIQVDSISGEAALVSNAIE